MNRYFLIRRLRGPAILLLIGVVALMHSTGLVQHPWHWFWPLLLILIGVMLLAERALMAQDGGYPLWPNQNPYGTTGVPPYQGQPAPTQQTAIVPSETHDFGKDPDGGQS